MPSVSGFVVVRFSRRHCILQIASLVVACAPQAGAFAETGSVSERDLTARWLNYRDDATSVDEVEHPKYIKGQVCANCRHYKGLTSDQSGPCTIFLGERVMAKGWCSVYEKMEG
ncbi:high-potential iron-sulfur protein [Paraburkholderia sp. GAS334]|uniref:high-potential iron-sulfur protein n=1 Tax=Paraburkholderia sp. GAS334 TaxID=3035131 RepID=UPI003D1A5FFE